MLFVRLCEKAFHSGPALLNHLASGTNSGGLLDGSVITGQAQNGVTTDFFRDDVNRLAEFAKGEVERDTPYLNSLAVVKIWSILENVVDGIVGFRLLDPATYEAKKLAKVKILLTDLAAFRDKEYESEYLVESLKREINAPLQLGIGRFEHLLEAVRLGGAPHDGVRFVLLELSQIRHAIVHRNGMADAKLLEQCTWLRHRRGDKIEVRGNQLEVYYRACCAYILELFRRLCAECGGVLPDVAAGQLKSFETASQKYQQRATSRRKSQNQATSPT